MSLFFLPGSSQNVYTVNHSFYKFFIYLFCIHIPTNGLSEFLLFYHNHHWWIKIQDLKPFFLVAKTINSFFPRALCSGLLMQLYSSSILGFYNSVCFARSTSFPLPLKIPTYCMSCVVGYWLSQCMLVRPTHPHFFHLLYLAAGSSSTCIHRSLGLILSGHPWSGFFAPMPFWIAKFHFLKEQRFHFLKEHQFHIWIKDYQFCWCTIFFNT